MRAGPITYTAQRLHAAQSLLTAPAGWGLHCCALAMRLRPDGFSAEFRAEHAETMRQTLAERWLHQSFLPDTAPNDPPSLGAA